MKEKNKRMVSFVHCLFVRLTHSFVVTFVPKAGNPLESRKACSEAIKIDDEPRLYCDRADAFLQEDMFDEVSAGYLQLYLANLPMPQALRDFRTALEKDEGFSRAKEGIAKAQKLQKQAGKRDYYKILGVKRSASKKEINKV